MPTPTALSFANPFVWDITATYTANEVVYASGKTYTALQAVPANTQITNTTYWAETGPRIGKIDANANDINTLEENVDNMLISLYTPQSNA